MSIYHVITSPILILSTINGRGWADFKVTIWSDIQFSIILSTFFSPLSGKESPSFSECLVSTFCFSGASSENYAFLRMYAVIDYIIGLKQSLSMSHVETSFVALISLGLFITWFTDLKYKHPFPPNPAHIHWRKEGEVTTLRNAVAPLVDHFFWGLLPAICRWRGYK